MDQHTVDRAAPVVLLLQEETRPITIYIESPGGSTRAADDLERLVRLPSQDSGESCRLITVGLNFCASAASDLLIAGDYALIYPHTLILAHGTRIPESSSLTRERAVDLAKNLELSNEQFALKTARNAIQRFVFRFVLLRSDFAAIREERAGDTSEWGCFVIAMQNRAPRTAADLLGRAVQRHLGTEINELELRSAISEEDAPTRARAESLLIKCIIDRQLKVHSNESGWSFREQGLSELQDEFELLLRSLEEDHKAQINALIKQWSSFLWNGPSEVAEDDTAREANVSGLARSLWFIFVEVCRLLQQSENLLSAEDAYWLGLIDEVIGRPDLPSTRVLVEYAPAEQGGE